MTKLTYVYDIQKDEKRWVEDKYVKLYPQLYIPVYYNGIKIQSEIVEKK